MQHLGYAGSGGLIYTIFVAVIGAVLLTLLLRLVTGNRARNPVALKMPCSLTPLQGVEFFSTPFLLVPISVFLLMVSNRRLNQDVRSRWSLTKAWSQYVLLVAG